MPFKPKDGVVVEVQVFNGRRYRRYPESPRASHRRYFSRAGARLHRDVWEYHNGPVPDGFHVHHIDGDTTNNAIDNLACIPRSEHWAEHREDRVRAGRSIRQLEHLERIREKAAGWHKSDEGRQWHREHAKTSLAKAWAAPRVYPDIEKACFWCGAIFTAHTNRAKFCSPTCQNAESRFRTGRSPYQHPHHAACVRPDSGG